MRDARETARDCKWQPTIEDSAVVIEADRREAKLAALREAYDRCCPEFYVTNALNVINNMIAELEKGPADATDK